MKETQIKPVSTLVAQYPAGQPIRAIISDEGTVYVPLLEGSFGSSAPTKKSSAAASVTDEEVAAAPASQKRGRKTEEETTAPGGVSAEKVSELVSKLNSGKIDETEAAKSLKALTTDKKVHAAIQEVIDNFMADSNITEEACTADMLKAFGIKASGAGRGRGSKKDEAAEVIDPTEESAEPIDLKDLSVGDKVLVELKAPTYDEGYYEAEVTKVGRKVTFKFDDGDVLEYDPATMGDILPADSTD